MPSGAWIRHWFSLGWKVGLQLTSSHALTAPARPWQRETRSALSSVLVGISKVCRRGCLWLVTAISAVSGFLASARALSSLRTASMSTEPPFSVSFPAAAIVIPLSEIIPGFWFLYINITAERYQPNGHSWLYMPPLADDDPQGAVFACQFENPISE
ncbi:Uncharacterised protein [Mycobacteroides abscessus subsp. abscessus]|nr:Uncharacterised protein [Mycobacteroides abscessus subsp. abscessus]